MWSAPNFPQGNKQTFQPGGLFGLIASTKVKHKMRFCSIIHLIHLDIYNGKPWQCASFSIRPGDSNVVSPFMGRCDKSKPRSQGSRSRYCTPGFVTNVGGLVCCFLSFFLLGAFVQENNQNCSYTINWHQVTSRNYDVDVDTIETVLIQVWKIYIGTYLQSLKQSRLNAQILNV